MIPQCNSPLSAHNERRNAPVFVLGSPRSGTTLLYDMLLSAGGFAVYLAESNVFNLLTPRFGELSSRKNLEQALEAWLGSKLFRASGLEAEAIRKLILRDCHSSGDFLRIVMEKMCAAQGAQRWAENSPEAMLYLPAIKQSIPNALVIHIIRDGRDVATSLGRLRYIHPFPWEKLHSVVGCGIYWEWIVKQGRKFGQALGEDYLEVRFEELLGNPQATLDKIGDFIGQPLDYETIQRVAYGSVSKPNTSFTDQSPNAGFSPVGRWRKSFSKEDLEIFEGLVGETLRELGYSTQTEQPTTSISLQATRWLHRSFFATKFWHKNNRWLRPLRPTLKGSDIDEIVLAEDHPPILKEASVHSR